MQYNEILFQIDQGIALITLNRPDIRNAVSGAGIIRELEEACKFVNADGSVKTLILTGEDPAFSSGGNIKEMAAKRECLAAILLRSWRITGVIYKEYPLRSTAWRFPQ